MNVYKNSGAGYTVRSREDNISVYAAYVNSDQMTVEKNVQEKHAGKHVKNGRIYNGEDGKLWRGKSALAERTVLRDQTFKWKSDPDGSDDQRSGIGCPMAEILQDSKRVRNYSGKC